MLRILVCLALLSPALAWAAPLPSPDERIGGARSASWPAAAAGGGADQTAATGGEDATRVTGPVADAPPALLSKTDASAADPVAGDDRLLPDGTSNQDLSILRPAALELAGAHAMWDPLGMGCVDGGAIDDPFPGGKGDLRVAAFCIPQPCAAPVTEEELARDILGRPLREGEYAKYLDRRAASCGEVASLSDDMRDIVALLTARSPGTPIFASTLHHAAPILSAQRVSARMPTPLRGLPTGVFGSGGVRLAEGLRAAPGPGGQGAGVLPALPATGSGPESAPLVQGPPGSVPPTPGNPPAGGGSGPGGGGAGPEGPGGPLPGTAPEVTVIPLPPTLAALLAGLAALTLTIRLDRRRRVSQTAP